MDSRTFDRFARLVATTGSRRDTWRAMLAATVLAAVPNSISAKQHGKNWDDRKRKRRRRRRDDGTPSASLCPPDPSNNETGFVCAGGYCSCGGECCSDPDCWVMTRSIEGGDDPRIVVEEACEPPGGCNFCQGNFEQCCTGCIGPTLECASSGPISGGTIRRR